MLDGISNVTTQIVDCFRAELDESGRISPYKKRSIPDQDHQDWILTLGVMAARGALNYRLVDQDTKFVVTKFDTEKFVAFCDQFKPDSAPSNIFSHVSKLKQKFLYVLSAPTIDGSGFKPGINFFAANEKITQKTVDPSRSEEVPDGKIPARLDYFGGFIVTMNGERYQIRGKTGATEDIIDTIFEHIKRYPHRKYGRKALANAINNSKIEHRSLRTVFRRNILMRELSPFAEIGYKYISIHPLAYLTPDQAEAIIAIATKV